MRKLIAAVVAVVSVGAVALPSAPPVYADEAADVEVDGSATADTSPDAEPEPAPEPEPEPAPEPEPDPEPVVEADPIPAAEPDPEPEDETSNDESIEDAPEPDAEVPALGPAPTSPAVETRTQRVSGPQWTEPMYPEQPAPTECVQQKIEKATSTYMNGSWSAWTDWPNVGPVWDDGRARTGHHGGTHGENGDRHFAYIVVGERPITYGECAPKVSVLMGEEVEKCVDGVSSFVLAWTASTTHDGSYKIWVHDENSAPSTGYLYESGVLPVPGTSGTVTIPTSDPPLYDSESGAVTIIATVLSEEYRSTERTSGETDCRPEEPEYEPDIEKVTTDCQTGDTEVTVTTTTTTYKAVWNPQTNMWDKVVDEVTEEQTTRPLNEQEQEECRPTYDPETESEEGECEEGDDVVTFSSQTTTYKAVWNAETGMWDKEVDEMTAISGVRFLTEEEQEECEPPADVETTDWEDGEYECEDTMVEQTRTVTTTPYIYVEGEWVLDEENATSVTETQNRDLDEDEITECPIEPSIEFTTLGPVCLENIPYIRWIVSEQGVDPSLPLTITISLEGDIVETIEDAPFQGQTLWPGASAEPPDWPGWALNAAGVWVEDPSDEALRGTLTVTASVNPEVSGTVDYPEATGTCEDPPTTPTTPTPSTPGGTPTLPATGSSMVQLLMLASIALALGSATVFFSGRRRLAD